MERLHKAKEDIKAFYLNFFRNCTLKKEQLIFHQWKSEVECQKQREKKVMSVRKYSEYKKDHDHRLRKEKFRISSVSGGQQQEHTLSPKSAKKGGSQSKMSAAALKATPFGSK